jgi:hypothetical protein
VINPKTGEALYTLRVDPDVMSTVAGPLADALQKAAVDPELEGLGWVVLPGVSSIDYPLIRRRKPVSRFATGRQSSG